MIEIISVRFKEGGKQYYFHPQGLTVAAGDDVIVDTVRGLEYATCTVGNNPVEDTALTQPLRTVVRLANEEDRRTLAKNKEKEARAVTICQEKIISHKLDMKLVEAEYSFEGNKVVLFFTAEGRVDFRALVKDLASAIHARIELRQIGVRDEAKLLGGLGICGRPFCCSQFLDDFQPVSIKMAKTQNLSLNPTKISGTCGRLMCCLKYEQDAYEDLVKRVPRQDSFVETPDGAGSISSVNLLREKVNVRLESAPEKPHTYHSTEVRVIRSGKGKRPEGYVEPPLQELASLRREEEEKAPDPISVSVNPLAAKLEAVFSGQSPDEGQRPNRNGDRNRRNRRSGGGKPRPEGGQNAPAKEENRPPRQDRNRPRPKPAVAEGEEKQEKQENRSRRRPNKPRPQQGGEGNKPRTQQGAGGEKPQSGEPRPKPKQTPRPPKAPKPQGQPPKPQAQSAKPQGQTPKPQGEVKSAPGGQAEGERKPSRPRRRRPRTGAKPKAEES